MLDDFKLEYLNGQLNAFHPPPEEPEMRPFMRELLSAPNGEIHVVGNRQCGLTTALLADWRWHGGDRSLLFVRAKPAIGHVFSLIVKHFGQAQMKREGFIELFATRKLRVEVVSSDLHRIDFGDFGWIGVDVQNVSAEEAVAEACLEFDKGRGIRPFTTTARFPIGSRRIVIAQNPPKRDFQTIYALPEKDEFDWRPNELLPEDYHQ
ncbi:MAG: hypothetical protein EKK48_12190 [Candidatus Melainabacteria bacterium]|nr:MAG: hypothetical protein EKK48_12190 [Candidatus Melainabacteria bacterium]